MYGPVHSLSICVLPLTEISFQFERVHLHKQPTVFVVHRSHPCQLLSDLCGSSGSQLCQTDCPSELSIQSDGSEMVLVRHRRWSLKLHPRLFGIEGRTVEQATVEDNGWGRSNEALKQVDLAETSRIRSCEKIHDRVISDSEDSVPTSRSQWSIPPTTVNHMGNQFRPGGLIPTNTSEPSKPLKRSRPLETSCWNHCTASTTTLTPAQEALLREKSSDVGGPSIHLEVEQ